MKGSSEAGTKLCLAALSRVVKPQDAAPCEDDGSAQHVGGHGLVGHHSVARTSGARENSPGLKADGLACVAVGGPAQSRWEGYAPTDYSRRGALPETARRKNHSVAPGATDGNATTLSYEPHRMALSIVRFRGPDAIVQQSHVRIAMRHQGWGWEL